MFRILLSRALQSSIARTGFALSKSRPDFRYFLTSSFSSSAALLSENEGTRSFAVSYLVSSCGLSPESAIAASKKVEFENPKKPDSVLSFLREYGFSKTQVSNFVERRPDLLVADPEKTLLPKLEFFLSKGLSKEDITRVISANPGLLSRGLNSFIVPTYHLLRSLLLSDEKVLSSLACKNRASFLKNSDNLVQNVRLLRDIGVGESRIGDMFVRFPEIVFPEQQQFSERVNKVRDMGLDPRKSTFIYALHTLSLKSFEKIWNRSYKVYEQFGWSKDHVLQAFRQYPSCMLFSEEKLQKKMDFLVNEMGLPSVKISECPVFLFYSLEKRVLPRCSVVRVLLSKGLIEQSNLNFYSVLKPVEKRFLDQYVTKYLDKVPLLLSVYQGKVDHKGA